LRVGDVLDHLTCPHDVEAAVLERQRRVRGEQAEIDVRMALAGTPERLDSDIGRDNAHTGFYEQGREMGLAAAEVEQARRRGADAAQISYAGEQQALPQGGIRRRQFLGNRFPHRFVIVAPRHLAGKARRRPINLLETAAIICAEVAQTLVEGNILRECASLGMT
jgi:hypothetical protein